MEPANRPVMAWIVYGDCIGQWLSSITKYTRQLTYKDRKCSQLEGSSLISLGLTVLGECKLTQHDSSGRQWGKNLQQKSGSKRGKESKKQAEKNDGMGSGHSLPGQDLMTTGHCAIPHLRKVSSSGRAKHFTDDPNYSMTLGFRTHLSSKWIIVKTEPFWRACEKGFHNAWHRTGRDLGNIILEDVQTMGRLSFSCGPEDRTWD